MIIKRVGLIGNGHVASTLGRAWMGRGLEFLEVFNRQNEVPAWIPSNSRCRALESVADFDASLDAVLVAVSDDAIFEVMAKIPEGPIVVHFSGALPLPHRPGGVIWPIQAIRSEISETSQPLPLVIDATDDRCAKALKNLAEGISSTLYFLNTSQRNSAHLAAVFASNFCNHNMAIAQQFTAETTLPWTVFEALIKTTFESAIQGLSKTRQTGPAMRNDTTVLEAHKNSLQDHPLWLELYKTMTQSIQTMHTTDIPESDSQSKRP